jgi:hypothetical protein
VHDFRVQRRNLILITIASPAPEGIYLIELLVAPVERRIWSKAWIKHSYTLTNKMELPARLYYKDKLLAMIIE